MTGRIRSFSESNFAPQRTMLWLSLAALIALAAIMGLTAGCGEEADTETARTDTGRTATAGTVTEDGAMTFSFETPKKSAHYESNTPAHEAILPAPPINVVIDVNFDLAPPSSISIMSDGKEYGVGETIIDDNKLAMRRDVDPQAPDGLYDVNYNACWPDGSCHDGHFQFAIDRSLTSSLVDLTDRTNVMIMMTDISFQPDDILIKAGTTVTWLNNDGVEHFINTDSHPAHSYYPAMNSRGLAQGATFQVTFTRPGAYPYHCSAHPDRMSGLIVVK